MKYSIVDSPCGPLTVVVADTGVKEISYTPVDLGAHWRETTDLDAVRRLEEYFAGARTQFDLRLAPSGTPFQKSVWSALLDIPFGQTRSYGELARAIGRPTASRAVGAANGRNPISIVVPCHRVIGADGSLTGYAGGLERKQTLLALEGRNSRQTELF